MSLESTASEKVAKEAMRELEPMIRETGAEIFIDSLPVVKVDRILFKQVFQNLLSNAIKFRREASPKIHIFSEQKNGVTIFFVRDNGLGMDSGVANALFETGNRLDIPPLREGTGIGLTICKQIVEAHGGHMWVQSKKGVGSVFCFSINH